VRWWFAPRGWAAGRQEARPEGEAFSPTFHVCKCLATLLINTWGRWVFAYQVSAFQRLGDRERIPEVKFLTSISAFRLTGSRPQRSSFCLFGGFRLTSQRPDNVSLGLWGSVLATGSTSRQSRFWLRVRPNHPVRLRARFHRKCVGGPLRVGALPGDRKHVPKARPSAQPSMCVNVSLRSSSTHGGVG
jgi:hypothetical protein